MPRRARVRCRCRRRRPPAPWGLESTAPRRLGLAALARYYRHAHHIIAHGIDALLFSTTDPTVSRSARRHARLCPTDWPAWRRGWVPVPVGDRCDRSDHAYEHEWWRRKPGTGTHPPRRRRGYVRMHIRCCDVMRRTQWRRSLELFYCYYLWSIRRPTTAHRVDDMSPCWKGVTLSWRSIPALLGLLHLLHCVSFDRVATS